MTDAMVHDVIKLAKFIAICVCLVFLIWRAYIKQMRKP